METFHPFSTLQLTGLTRPLSLCQQESKGYEFESETDTESIAKLVKYMYDNRESDISFATLVEQVTQHLEGAFALVFKSVHYPGEAVGTRRVPLPLRHAKFLTRRYFSFDCVNVSV